MKRKLVVLTAVLLLLFIAMAGSFLYGFICNEKQIAPHDFVRKAYSWSQRQAVFHHIYRLLGVGPSAPRVWHSLPTLPDGQVLSDAQRDAVDKLLAIGYLGGYEAAPAIENVTRHDPELAYEALNLYTSGHAPEAILMDMSGKVLHKWSIDYREAFPDQVAPDGLHYAEHWRREYWRRVYLYENGDLLAIFPGLGILKVDKTSELLWSVSLGCHHDIFVDAAGMIYLLAYEVKVLPRIHEYEPVLEDFIVVMDQEGNIVRKLSLLEAFERSSYASFLNRMPAYGDLFHTNTIEVFDGSLAGVNAIYEKGNILISVREIDTIAVVDMEKGRVIWALSGQWIEQHQPTLLDNGNILLFDNKGHNGMSKVIELDPFQQEIVWAYEGTPENGFLSKSCGSNQRLPNGNTLITQSNSGRAFEVTSSNQIVWEFYNPARAGEDDELIATLFEVIRLGSNFPVDWLPSPEEGGETN